MKLSKSFDRPIFDGCCRGAIQVIAERSPPRREVINGVEGSST